MATYGKEVMTDEEREAARKRKPELTLWDFANPRGPWVLVPEGSLMGYFDWVPKHLRVGPWSLLAPLYLAALCGFVMYMKPPEIGLMFANEPSPYPQPYSPLWCYNLIGFFWMIFVLYLLRGGGMFIFCTYTIQSWTMMTVRHGLSALAPFLSQGHPLLLLHDILKFPVLATATVTFFVWNTVLMPFILFYAHGKDPKRRKQFLGWCFNFRMSQIHLFNVLYAVLNTVSSQQNFTDKDLWCALVGMLLYGLFYVLVLDRIGCHLYPVFSPRTWAFGLTWSFVIGCYFGVYGAWNKLITDGTLSNLVSELLRNSESAFFRGLQ